MTHPTDETPDQPPDDPWPRYRGLLRFHALCLAIAATALGARLVLGKPLDSPKTFSAAGATLGLLLLYIGLARGWRWMRWLELLGLPAAGLPLAYLAMTKGKISALLTITALFGGGFYVIAQWGRHGRPLTAREVISDLLFSVGVLSAMGLAYLIIISVPDSAMIPVAVLLSLALPTLVRVLLSPLAITTEAQAGGEVQQA